MEKKEAVQNIATSLTLQNSRRHLYKPCVPQDALSHSFVMFAEIKASGQQDVSRRI